MKPYELAYTISSAMADEQVLKESENIESFIQSKGGIILKSEKPYSKALAYTIKKQSSGFLGVLEFQLEPEGLEALKEKLQKNSKIIRHMIIVKNPVKIRKERRIKVKPIIFKEEKTNKKVGLEEIEKELDEILNK
ncbi:MAG: 30S ribosomal protein S6 [Candidatus Staskawiczbacteria bacterium]|nr:30S ribosomal protein S6 [Candidatus Staskawiczbacteria bacterium]